MDRRTKLAKQGGKEKPGLWPCVACYGRMYAPYRVVMTREGAKVVHGRIEDCKNKSAHQRILAQAIGETSRTLNVQIRWTDEEDQPKPRRGRRRKHRKLYKLIRRARRNADFLEAA